MFNRSRALLGSLVTAAKAVAADAFNRSTQGKKSPEGVSIRLPHSSKWAKPPPPSRSRYRGTQGSTGRRRFKSLRAKARKA